MGGGVEHRMHIALAMVSEMSAYVGRSAEKLASVAAKAAREIWT